MWKTSITKLIYIFRESLINLIPTLEKARISWKTKEAYDDWDEIAETLFKNIVIRSIQFHKEIGEEKELKVPKFDFRYDNYLEMSFIEVKMKSEIEKDFKTELDNIFVFRGFDTIQKPFDCVSCSRIDKSGNFQFIEEKIFPMDKVEFSFLLREEKLSVKRLTLLEVML